MLDLTKSIKLEPKLQKKYTAARIVLHLLFLAGILFVADRVLLPSISYALAFDSTKIPKNNLINPHTDSQEDQPSNGIVAAKDTLSFSTIAHRIFSNATVTFTTKTKDENLQNAAITIRKSYQAFFYHLGAPMGFEDGSLLTTNGTYYIISNGTLRKFANTDIILKLGYRKDAFAQVAASDLKYNNPGEDIVSANAYPDDSLFVVGDNYYQLQNQQLLHFISERAFLSRYDAIQAIPKNSDFLSSYPLSENFIGFADGTLASSGISVYILSEGKSYPIANPQTFVSMGFKWEDIVPLESDEISAYTQQKQFNDDQPHPNGTLFFDQATNQYSVVENGRRRPIESPAIVKNFAKQKPVLEDSNMLGKQATCTLKQLNANTYTCTAPLSSLRDNIGNNYEISATFNTNAEIASIDTTLSTKVTWANIRDSLSSIKGSLISNYTPKP